MSKPELIAFNRPLADLLGITGGQTVSWQKYLEEIRPQMAQNRFRSCTRAINWTISSSLETADYFTWRNHWSRWSRHDIQLKGSGRTPYSRGGDGRAWLGPVLREYVVSEAMHALGIPTTRALAAVLTGEQVIRENVLPGAVLTRVAQSHIRVGTFQVFSARKEFDALRNFWTTQLRAIFLRQTDHWDF